MRLTTLFIAAAYMATFPPECALAQAVDAGVASPDPSVKTRVQDVDHPDSALLPGGSSAWTGQPIMAQVASSTGSAASQKSSAMKTGPFPSLSSLSAWGTSSFVASSQNDSSPQQRVHGVSRWAKGSTARKLNLTTAAIDLHAARSRASEQETENEENQLTKAEADQNLRKLRRATQKSTRLRKSNPLSSRADAATTAHWGADSSSSYALHVQRHEEGMLLHYGYNARTDRENEKRRRHRAATPTPGNR